MSLKIQELLPSGASPKFFAWVGIPDAFVCYGAKYPEMSMISCVSVAA
jgi:hypothetical protein